MAQIAIIIPAMRPTRLPDVVHSIVESTNPGDYRTIVVATGEVAEVAKTLPVTLLEDSGGTWPQRINAAYRITDEPVILAAADDLKFHPGWLPALMSVMNEIDGCVAINDMMNPNGVHLAFSRNYIDNIGAAMGEPLGTVICEAFQHAYSDDFARKTAIHHGRWAIATESRVEHLHCGNGKAPRDEVYAMGEATMQSGLTTYTALAGRFA